MWDLVCGTVRYAGGRATVSYQTSTEGASYETDRLQIPKVRLKQALELYDFYDQQLQACDAELEAMYQEFDPPEDPGTPPPAPRTQKRRKNQAHFDLAPALYRLTGVDLTQIAGVDELTVQKVLSEIGTDMSKWPTVKHFTSWLRLCPNNKITGGKVIQAGVLPTKNRASVALRIAASTLKTSDSALGAYYRRMHARLGPSAAITATAHKLARIIYFMLLSMGSGSSPVNEMV